MKSWEEIEAAARVWMVKLDRRRASVSGYTATAIVSHLFDVSIADLDEPDADAMLRAMVWAALEIWKGLPS